MFASSRAPPGMVVGSGKKSMNTQSKLLDRQSLAAQLDDVRAAGRIIVFTNGCFDILHVGHVRYLSAAKSQGDVLVIGVNSDDSVRSIKGAQRPVVSQAQRAEVLAGLACVDYVTIFDESNPLELIKLLKPHVLAKGADWEADQIIGSDFVKAAGGRVARIPLVPDISTSKIIASILEKNRR